jgi:hypothetical protein
MLLLRSLEILFADDYKDAASTALGRMETFWTNFFVRRRVKTVKRDLLQGLQHIIW